MTTLKLTDRELDTVLAALRAWQALETGITTFGIVQLSDLRDIADNDRTADDAALSPEEIDDLCERINTGG